MANRASNACQLEFADLDQSHNLALPVPAEEAPGADEVHAAALSVAVTFPEWRREELARKYSDEQREERYERSFYHPYG